MIFWSANIFVVATTGFLAALSFNFVDVPLQPPCPLSKAQEPEKLAMPQEGDTEDQASKRRRIADLSQPQNSTETSSLAKGKLHKLDLIIKLGG